MLSTENFRFPGLLTSVTVQFNKTYMKTVSNKNQACNSFKQYMYIYVHASFFKQSLRLVTYALHEQEESNNQYQWICDRDWKDRRCKQWKSTHCSAPLKPYVQLEKKKSFVRCILSEFGPFIFCRCSTRVTVF